MISDPQNSEEFSQYLQGFDQEPPRMDKVPKGYQPKALEVFEKEFLARTQKFMTWRKDYLNEDYEFPQSWGFMFYKGLIQSISEYILGRKVRGNPCTTREVQRLRSSLETSLGADLYLRGAKLGLLLESQDPLNDAELFYLSRDEGSETRSSNAKSYSDQLYETLLKRIESRFHQQIRKRKVVQAGTATLSFGLVLALHWISYSL